MAQVSLKADDLRERALAAAGWLLPALILVIPVSTTATEILYWLWLFCAAFGVGADRLVQVLKHPAAWVSLVLLTLGVAGLAWTIAPAKEALKQLSVLFQFIALPVLFAQMQARPDVRRPLVALLVVAGVIWVLSLISMVRPGLIPTESSPGVPFKNYSPQSILFSLLAYGLVLWGIGAWRKRRRDAAMSLAAAALLIANVVFVSSSRTTLLALAPLLVLLFIQLAGWRGAFAGAVAALVMAAAVWLASPYVRDRIVSIPREINLAFDTGTVTSAGLRIIYWKKALSFVKERPLYGYGTGSVPELYRRAAYGTGLTADTPGDPHNQILALAIPFGVVGVAVLALLLLSHIVLFWGRGFLPFMGQAVLLLFIIGGLFNSHLMTFTESKIYLFSVGILGGLILSVAARYRSDSALQPVARFSRSGTQSR